MISLIIKLGGKMAYDDVFIPYGAYWSTPFARWQGSLSEKHSLELAAEVLVPMSLMDWFLVSLCLNLLHSMEHHGWQE